MTHSSSPKTHWHFRTKDNFVDAATKLPHFTETLVVGGGIIGTSTAYWLSKSGIDVVLIEQGLLANLASSQNVGILTFGPEEEYLLAIKNLGPANAKKVLVDTITNQIILEKLIVDENIQLEYMKTGFLSLACSERQLKILVKSAKLMIRDGLDVSLVNRQQAADLLGVSLKNRFIGGTCSYSDVLLNPVAYTYEMGRLAQRNGARIVKNRTVQSIEFVNGYWNANLSDGVVLTKSLILASGWATSNLIHDLDNYINLTSETVVSGQVSKGEFSMKMGWAGNNVLEYGRQDQDGTVLFGGISRTHKLENKTKQELQVILSRYIENTFNNVEFEIKKSWTGIISDSIDHVPIVGEHPSKKGLWYITAFGGQGLAFSQIMPSLLAKAIVEKDTNIIPSYAHPFRFFM